MAFPSPIQRRSRGYAWHSAFAQMAAGYRTSGTRGRNPFTKDTVCVMLRNRFYLGELPSERPADAASVRHSAVIGHELWEAAQQMRERRAATRRDTIPGGIVSIVYRVSESAVIAAPHSMSSRRAVDHGSTAMADAKVAPARHTVCRYPSWRKRSARFFAPSPSPTITSSASTPLRAVNARLWKM